MGVHIVTLMWTMRYSWSDMEVMRSSKKTIGSCEIAGAQNLVKKVIFGFFELLGMSRVLMIHRLWMGSAENRVIVNVHRRSIIVALAASSAIRRTPPEPGSRKYRSGT